MKIRSVEAELFHADRVIDRRIDTTKLVVAFRYFAEIAYKEILRKNFVHEINSKWFSCLTQTNKLPELTAAAESCLINRWLYHQQETTLIYAIPSSQQIPHRLYVPLNKTTSFFQFYTVQI